ncbi:MAG: efflux RND transporter periplasmic adaptor subunit [Xanthomonadales bacterium]|nr:efflux RND transporter periplasmic adaptor subunit [Xanthomonadales bacterium]
MTLILPLVLTALFAGCGSGPDGGTRSADEPAPLLRVTGELRSSNSRFFGPPVVSDMWNFTLAHMTPDGSMVREGMPILKFDAQNLIGKVREQKNSLNEKTKELEKQRIVAREQLAELALALEQARADRDKAALKADIPEELLARREYRENQLVLEQAEVTVRLRREELDRETIIQATEEEILLREIAVLEAEIARLEQSVSAMTIKAPADGVVIHVSDRHNSKPAVGDSVWRGRRVMEFPDLERLEVHLEIPERDSAQVSVGQRVSFSLDAVPDRPFFGRIVNLASVIHSKSGSQPARVFDATVALDETDPGLMRPGMSISAEIHALADPASTP